MLRPEIRQVLVAHPERIYSLWRSQVHATASAIVIEQKALSGPPLFVDCVWHHTSRLLLDSLRHMTLQLTVRRLERNQKALEDGSVLGSAFMSLEELFSKSNCRFEGLLPFKNSNKEALRTLAHLQVRLRLHALSTPPDTRPRRCHM